jgi:hypothetical protein
MNRISAITMPLLLLEKVAIFSSEQCFCLALLGIAIGFFAWKRKLAIDAAS